MEYIISKNCKEDYVAEVKNTGKLLKRYFIVVFEKSMNNPLFDILYPLLVRSEIIKT
jgi:hypothetical protein